MVTKCDVCGQPATWWMFVRVEVVDIGAGKHKTKVIRLGLCTQHEKESRKVLQRDEEQHERVARRLAIEDWRPRYVTQRFGSARTEVST